MSKKLLLAGAVLASLAPAAAFAQGGAAAGAATGAVGGAVVGGPVGAVVGGVDGRHRRRHRRSAAAGVPHLCDDPEGAVLHLQGRGARRVPFCPNPA